MWLSSSTLSPGGSSAGADLVLDALKQALCERRPVAGGLVHHSDRGVQCVSIKYTERLAEEHAMAA